MGEVNQAKTIKQNQLLNIWIKYQVGVIEAYTGFGKTVMGLKIIEKFRIKYDTPIVIVVPSRPLQEEWLRRLGDTPNCHVYIINTFTMSQSDTIVKDCGLLIVDEVHRCLNEDSQYFSTLLSTVSYQWFLGLSATLEKEHKKFLLSFGISTVAKITLEEGIKLGLVPLYTNYNLAVPMSIKEQEEYHRQNAIYHSNFSLFSTFDRKNSFSIAMACSLAGATKTGIFRDGVKVWKTSDEWVKEVSEESGYDEKEVRRKAAMWKRAMTGREKALIIENKFKAVKFLIDFFLKQDKKIIVFCPNIEIADLLEEATGAVAYHSKIRAKRRVQILEELKQSVIKCVITCKSLDEGYDLHDLSVGINFGFTSKSRQSIQRTGRLLRIDENNPDKVGIMVNLYCAAFVWEGKDVTPHDKNKLVKAQENQIVKWVELKELVNELK